MHGVRSSSNLIKSIFFDINVADGKNIQFTISISLMSKISSRHEHLHCSKMAAVSAKCIHTCTSLVARHSTKRGEERLVSTVCAWVSITVLENTCCMHVC